jgi:hypothetical protein
MQSEGNERWKELCAQAAGEKDPDKLIALVQEINRILDEQSQRSDATVKPNAA